MRYCRWILLSVASLALPLQAKASSPAKLKVRPTLKASQLASDDSASDNRHLVQCFNRKTLHMDVLLVSSQEQDSVKSVPQETAETKAEQVTPHAPSASQSPHTSVDSGRSALARSEAPRLPRIFDSKGGSTLTIARSVESKVIDTAREAKVDLAAGGSAIMHRLARLTAYWAGEGDYYTGRRVSATGIHLHGGHCAVDPSIIPYGSVVEIPGLGQFLAVDTGSAVVHRTAAREAGHNRAERGALVIDLFFEHRREGERFAALAPKYVSINWWTPSSTAHAAKTARSFFADEDWNLIYNKQL